MGGSLPVRLLAHLKIIRVRVQPADDRQRAGHPAQLRRSQRAVQAANLRTGAPAPSASSDPQRNRHDRPHNPRRYPDDRFLDGPLPVRARQAGGPDTGPADDHRQAEHRRVGLLRALLLVVLRVSPRRRQGAPAARSERYLPGKPGRGRTGGSPRIRDPSVPLDRAVALPDGEAPLAL
uniref:(northern house mosquito) hypothetical protein n=1 Tax=Culex pipiens TaxID=7175 RepID=A0A8D8F0G3_CULPI